MSPIVRELRKIGPRKWLLGMSYKEGDVVHTSKPIGKMFLDSRENRYVFAEDGSIRRLNRKRHANKAEMKANRRLRQRSRLAQTLGETKEEAK